MNEDKPWYTSQGVWASICSIVTSVLVTAGILTQETATLVVAQVPVFIISAVGIATGLWALYGRINATKRIG